MWQAILTALKGFGGGIVKGVGSSLGLDFAKGLPTLGAIKSPLPGSVAGKLTQVATTPVTSIWQKLGTTLGTKMMTSQAPSLPSPSLPSIDTSISVQQSRGYQGGKKKSQLETLLSQLAGR